ncbi:sensor histidine kinase [Enemella evansiae]|uniref:sensor histidine kinase n=1 Tax=Enemella evansiae TaxID=2016499 RepID=UPI000B969BB8|nr:ATP-binding protein [Enemella evansiae]OYO18269.1 hypothetical protein BI335_07860 [Enemella evansiae]TDO93806.1 signal transduction histidine kinase [Enemella evansiae]
MSAAGPGSPGPGAAGPGTVDPGGPGDRVLQPLFRLLAITRYALLALTLVVNLTRLGDSRSPVLVLLISGVMIIGSVVMQLLYAEPERRRTWLFFSDFLLTLILTALSGTALGVGGHWLPVTGFWAAAAPITLAVGYGWLTGTCSALVLFALIQLQHPDLRPEVLGLMASLVVGCGGLGYMVDRMRVVAAEQQRLSGNAAVIGERQRLARIVHDGVLQVLAMVEREGPHLGQRGMMLARHARDQEVQLRALLQERDIDPDSRNPRDRTHRNFAVALDRHASATVTVSTPAEPLLLESARALELDAVISEVLNNVAKHAGPNARAWLFLEVEGNTAMVSVRDNGVGGDPNQFAAAMRSGRMGMKDSIYGRIHELGGQATLRTAPGRGVEWEFRIPIEP